MEKTGDERTGQSKRNGFNYVNSETTAHRPSSVSSPINRTQIHRSFIHSRDDVKSSEQTIVEAGSSSPIKAAPVQPSQANAPIALSHSNTVTMANTAGNSNQVQQHQPTMVGSTQQVEQKVVAQGVPSTIQSNGNCEGQEEKDSNSQEGKSDRKKKKPKKDRSKLRKGKWTVEEEEYTSRIIHHFSTGLLTLPEGTTLRSYLAEKLNCDPMRITKKFAGASCLGKRVYHLCDRTQATVTDVEMAKGELARLEHRFRLRVEHGQTGVPLPPRTEVLPAVHVTPIYPQGAHVPHHAVQWAQSVVAAGPNGAIPLAQAPAPTVGPPVMSHTVQSAGPGTQLWLAPNTSMAPQPAPSNIQQPQSNPAVSQAGREMFALAWAQAAASLGPALSQLAAANLQQHQMQLQKAYESQLRTYGQQSVPAPAVAPAPGVAQSVGITPIQAAPGPAMQAPQSAPQVAQQHGHAPQANIVQSPHTIQTAHTSQPQYAMAPGPPSHIALVHHHHHPPGAMAPPANYTIATQQFIRPSVVATPVATQQQHHVQSQVPQAQAPHATIPQHTIIPAHTFHPPPIAAKMPAPSQITAPAPAVQQNVLPQQSMGQTQAQIPAVQPQALSPPAPAARTIAPSVAPQATAEAPAVRTKEDEDAGTMLMGFITSLRKGFMEAKHQKDKELQASKVQQEIADSSSGTTSQAADSSPDDSESDKGVKEPSSSEDSDKDSERPRGPPRKRLKTKRVIGEMTSKNVAAHNTRMDALHAAQQIHSAVKQMAEGASK